VNYLQICQRACQECGVANGAAAATVLPTVVNPTGSAARIVSWVGDAWNELQTLHDDWEWMRSSVLLGAGVSFQTVAGQASYPLGTGAGTVGVGAAEFGTGSFGKWDRTTFRNNTTANGYKDEIPMGEIPYDQWRDGYMLGAMRSVETRPTTVAIGPDQSVCLAPPPNALYTVTADYFTGPSALAADTDTPTGLPTRFHMLLVYGAMAKYGQYESAPEVYTRGTTDGMRMRKQLEVLRLPIMTSGAALA
jgi:hypothetical protein